MSLTLDVVNIKFYRGRGGVDEFLIHFLKFKYFENG